MDQPSEYTSPEWLDRFVAYTEQKGRKKQELEENDTYTYSSIRFVKNRTHLNVSYGLLHKDPKAKIPNLKLPDQSYDEISNLGCTLKILNGYIDQSHNREEATFTPDKTNILIPHVSYIIQEEEDKAPVLRPGGMLEDNAGAVIAFMSGGCISSPSYTENTGLEKQVMEFYDSIYKDDRDRSVSIYSGNKVADEYAPLILQEAINPSRAASYALEIFCDPYLAGIAERIHEKYSYTKDAKGQDLIKNVIHLTAQFLHLLFKNNITFLYKEREVVVQKLIDEFMDESSKPEIKKAPEGSKQRFDETTFKEAIKNKKSLFVNADLKWLRNSVNQLEDENDKAYIETLCDYIYYSYNPNQLKSLEARQDFWRRIINLGAELQCKNPSSDGSISVAQRLRKYAIDREDHTEQLFIKLIRANPLLLTQGLKKIPKPESDQSEFKPKFLGIIIDAFSWLDICKDCGDYLNNNLLWIGALKDVRPEIEKSGFSLSFPAIDSLFRVISQTRYGNTPFNLEKVRGEALEWDFRVLSEMRYTLATRYVPKDTLRRDRVFTRISDSVTRVALTQPLEFWINHPLVSKALFVDRPQDASSSNVIDILLLRFPENKPLKLCKIFIEEGKKNYDEVYRLSRSLIVSEQPISLDEEDKKLLTALLFINNNSSNDEINMRGDTESYLKNCFTETCIEKTKTNKENAKQYLIEFARYGLLHSQDESKINDFESASEYIKKSQTNSVKNYPENWPIDIRCQHKNSIRKAIAILDSIENPSSINSGESGQLN